VHPQYDRIQVGSDVFLIPTHFIRQQPEFFQSAFAGFEYFVIRSGDSVAFSVEGNGQIVHGAAANGNEMDFHSEDIFEMPRCGKCMNGSA